MIRNKKKLVKVLSNIAQLLVKCGGPGSGIPGPCPESHPHHVSHGEQKLKSGDVLKPVKQSRDGIWRHADGEPVPVEMIKKLKLSPQWKKDGTENPNALKDVRINPNPHADCLLTGKDSKGREKRTYSDNHDMQASAQKFGRVTELRKKREQIFKEVDFDINLGKKSEEALATKLIMKTGMRPGSDTDTKAAYKSYGATTLEGRHIVQKEDGSIVARFVPGKKKGQEIEMPIHDKALGQQLLEKAKTVGPEGRLFKTTADKVREYSKSKDGGGFKTKDHRTALGTETAIEAIKSLPEPKNMKEYKNVVKEVATKVSDVLGNTPSIALKAYIDPHVFEIWKSKAGI